MVKVVDLYSIFAVCIGAFTRKRVQRRNENYRPVVMTCDYIW